jgi:pyruvate dehydrogenase E2 component (dihydrolipoamide acetyltransferase)
MTMYAFRLPDIGEGVAEGEVVAWRVEPGQHVVEDQEMVEVMTDKATVTIGAPRAGRIAQLNANVGEKVLVGSVLVVIDTSDNGDLTSERREPRPSRPPENDTARSRFQAPAKPASLRPVPSRASDPGPSRESVPPSIAHAPESALRPPLAAKSMAPVAARGDVEAENATETAASAVGVIRESLPGSSFFTKRNGAANGTQHAVVPAPSDSEFYTEKPLATPATRKLARDLGIDLHCVPPSGDGGRVTKDDVRGFTSTSSSRADSPASTPVKSGASRTLGVVSQDAQGLEERKPFVGLRRRIAERMQMTTQKAAHFTFVEEVDVDALVALLERLRPSAEKLGVKLNYLHFIVKAVTLALKKHPALNSSLDEAKNELVTKRYYHVGIATATEQGLLVPVLRDADKKSPLELAREIQRLSDGARAGTLQAQELSGSTFTVTSLGKLGGLLATPVLNYPEVGILGVHRVKEKPVVRAGQIVIGKIMLLSLSFDHRIIDGHVGAAFAYDVIAYLENPDLLLLELA